MAGFFEDGSVNNALKNLFENIEYLNLFKPKIKTGLKELVTKVMQVIKNTYGLF